MKSRFLYYTFFMFVLIPFTINTVSAKEVKGVDFPETTMISGTTCKLVGVGIRKKIIINVYLGALYLEKPTNNSTVVISSDQSKRVVMHFLYKEVSAVQLVEAWNEGFEKNAGDSVNKLKSKINMFNGFFKESAKKGEKIVITYIPGKGTEVSINAQVKGVIEGKDFMEALFSIWFGPNPPSKGLKKGMLGD